MMNPANLAHTIALAIVVIACVVHLTTNVDKTSTHCERWGFVLTGAGAFGDAVYRWTSIIEPWDFELTLHVGMALIALSLVHGDLRGWLSRVRGFRWMDRRKS